LLIIADGASSKLRAYLRPNDHLEYSGAVLRGGLSRFNDKLPTPIHKDWGFALSGDGVSCFVSPVDDQSLVWAVGHLEDEQVPAIDRDSVDDAKAVILRARALGTRFSEPFKTIVDHTDLTTIMCLNAKDKMPFKHDKILPTIAAVFIGDSNHALSPFAGYGANLALCDGWDLAERLTMAGAAERGSSLAEAVAAYDAISVPRAVRIVRGSRARLKMGHGAGWKLWLFCIILAFGRFVSWVWRRE
jgi:2-polyprenyl-6-methoxyphenol hydroxylase-like FAD-dependent oxidoreductase